MSTVLEKAVPIYLKMDTKFMSTVLEKAVPIYLKIVLLLRPKIAMLLRE